MSLIHATGSIYQVAFVVDDLEAAASAWGRRGAGPFYRFDDFHFTGRLYPTGVESPRLTILLGYSGDTMIELMRVEDDQSGLFSVPRRPCAHHLAMLVTDVDDYLDELACHEQLVFRGLFPSGTPVALLDTRAQTGLLTELVTLDDAVRFMIAQMREEAGSFDGSRLIRTFG